MALTKADSASKTPTPIEIEVPPSFENAIVFGHRDADGHLAAEQTRDYLVQNGLRVTTVVSSLTDNYNFWKRLPTIDLSGYELVVFVDIAFRFSNPSESLDYLLKVADDQGGKRFIAIDHHLIPRPEWDRGNLELYEVSDPYDCCLGLPNPELMAVAALCDGAPTRVLVTPELQRRARGVRRAAADVSGVAGERLLKLVRQRKWEILEALADEDVAMHRNARGIRRGVSEPSPLLQLAMRLAY